MASCGPGKCCVRQPSERRRPAAVLSTASRARLPTSGALCRAPCPLGRSPASRRARLEFTTSSSKPVPSSGQSAFHRRVPPHGSSPPYPRLRRRGPASDALSLRTATRSRPFVTLELGPRVFCGGRASLVDFCNQNNPRARAADRVIPSLVRRVAPADSVRAGSRRPFHEPEGPGWSEAILVESSQARGRAAFAPRRPASRSLVRRALPQPAGLGHLMSWLRGERGWMLRSRRARSSRAGYEPTRASPLTLDSPRPTKTRSRGSLAAPLAHARVAIGRGPPPVLLREEGHVPLHPRCLPSRDHPFRGLSAYPQDVTRLWINCRRLFDSLSGVRPLTRLTQE